jgi:hypothetical protein
VPAGGLTQQQIAERLAATKAQGMTAPQVEPVMAQRPSPSSVPVPEGPPEPSIEAAKPAKSPQQILNEEAIAKRRAAYQESLKQKPTQAFNSPRVSEPDAPQQVEFISRPGKAPNMGSTYGQDIEPAGKYINIVDNPSTPTPEGGNYVRGTAIIKKPLVLDEGDSVDTVAWKQKLSKRYGGKTGKELTDAIIKDGYDAIITKDKYGTSESVLLKPSESIVDPSAELARRLGTPSDAERRFPPNKSGLPSNPPTARKARGKVSDLADMPIEPPKPVEPAGPTQPAATEQTISKGPLRSGSRIYRDPRTDRYVVETGSNVVGNFYSRASAEKYVSERNMKSTR